ncbi:putative baseplate assembly protein [Streptacidiphilus sp. PB12-B1b]|uniref:putative baseplate assembly protein n=1 Tax=Streptacidiphilus sp. PB12-B1b TaxID=2705012 RepID=UPI0015FBEA62|nr:putative baseplate assembly protein [Streptacidiphilus sp. PB12-B1b]QMU78011.1 putative baseplate assembly protein [Streptacidiphilus sp. PB12-B1b]
MPLPVPDLDDRRFQDLVDEAKRLVMRRCPEWTDHNVSDPGITLIETFAQMTDHLLYRLNQVPDRLYVTFLNLIGLRMLPPTPARTPVTFWLSSPARARLTIAAGTRVGTLRTATAESIVFTTRADLAVVPCSLAGIRTPADPEPDAGPPPTDDPRPEDGGPTADRSRLLADGRPFPAFRQRPGIGDALLVGLSEPVPGCVVRLGFRGRVEGVGVNPKHPPLTWEAWTGDGWAACEPGLDETGGLNTSGAIVLHIPAGHRASVVDGDRAGWIRARVVEPEEGQPPYRDSPVVDGLTVCTVGGTVEAVHAEPVGLEQLGQAEGVPGQQLPLRHSPVLAGYGPPVVETSSPEGWLEWTEVENFADSGPQDRHFALDAVSGLVLFGPAVREADGSLRHYGAVPEKGAEVRIRGYATGGGARGNVAAGSVCRLKSSIPSVSAVENRRPAQGGVDGETLDEAKDRGPLLVRTRSRAVTAEDYEILAREAAPEIARVRCVPTGRDPAEAGGVRVLVVPAAAAPDGRILFENLVPPEPTLSRIAARLDRARVVGTRVVLEPPLYRGVTVVARLVARPRVNVERVREDALDILYRYLSPLPGGGPEGAGWPFGRPVQAGEIFGRMQQLHGVELVEDVRLFSADPVSGVRGKEVRRIDLDPNSLVYSYEHQVRVEAH